MFQNKYYITVIIGLLILSMAAACNITDSDDEEDENGLPTDDPEFSSDYVFNVSLSAGDHVVELSFGQIEGASNSYDPGIDLEAPPAPPGNVIHAWFENDGRNLFKDFRDQVNTEIVWSIIIDPASHETIAVEWASEIIELPGNVAMTNAEGVIVEDMRNQNSVELTVEELRNLQFEFIAEIDPDSESVLYLIDEETAIQVAENLLFPEEMGYGFEERSLTVDDFFIQKTVESITPIEDSKGINALYVINYEDGGFVVLSADQRVEPVLAYSVNTVFPIEDDIYNPGLVDWFIYTVAHIEEERNEKERPLRTMLLLWETAISSQLDVYYISISDLCPEEGFVQAIGPHLETQWGQGCGYNDNVDYSCANDSHRCHKAPTGCVATAMAQIARFWNKGYEKEDGTVAVHVYDIMPDKIYNEGESPGLAALMSNMGELVDMNYGCEGSGADSGDAYDEFVDNFGFSSAKERDLETESDYNLLISNIENGYPVYMRGCNVKEKKWKIFTTYDRCHAWIADGTYERVNCLGDVIEDTFKIHMNWGWNGSSDGEYRIKGKNGNYPYDRSVIYDIFD